MTCLTDPFGPSTHCVPEAACRPPGAARAAAPAVAAAVTPSVSATAADPARSVLENLLPTILPYLRGLPSGVAAYGRGASIVGGRPQRRPYPEESQAPLGDVSWNAQRRVGESGFTRTRRRRFCAASRCRRRPPGGRRRLSRR